MRRCFDHVVHFVALLVLLLAAAESRAARPNIILVMTDDR